MLVAHCVVTWQIVNEWEVTGGNTTRLGLREAGKTPALSKNLITQLFTQKWRSDVVMWRSVPGSVRLSLKVLKEFSLYLVLEGGLC